MITLGQKVQDVVTGFEGIATARVEYLNGCVQYCVKPRVDGSGKTQDAEYIDQQQLVVVDDGVLVEARQGGGPQRDTPSANYRG